MARRAWSRSSWCWPSRRRWRRAGQLKMGQRCRTWSTRRCGRNFSRYGRCCNTSRPRRKASDRMGIRVDAFVVDVVQFGALIERPLWRILTETSQVEFDGDAIFGAYDRATQTRFLIRADHRIARYRPGAGVVEVPPDELRSDPFLRQTTREYIAQGSSYDLSFLLRTWSLFPTKRVSGRSPAATAACGSRRSSKPRQSI